ncbi:toprim domain-containing protein [Candidatus Pacearchaeota archaeon]|nr:toprim domain-containing protein [Candidatus Pacearchaeota archaeon]
MRARTLLEEDIEKAKKNLVIVEGKNDEKALREIGFQEIFIINETGRSLNEGIEIIEQISHKRKVCILTDFDKRGKMLFLKIKSGLAERGIKMDNTLRGALLKCGISHIEGIEKCVK